MRTLFQVVGDYFCKLQHTQIRSQLFNDKDKQKKYQLVGRCTMQLQNASFIDFVIRIWIFTDCSLVWMHVKWQQYSLGAEWYQRIIHKLLNRLYRICMFDQYTKLVGEWCSLRQQDLRDLRDDMCDHFLFEPPTFNAVSSWIANACYS